MKKASLIVIGTLLAFAIAGCCKSKKEESGSGTTTATDPAPGATAAAGSGSDSATLTGEDGVKKLKAKGWKAIMEPTTTDSGPAKVTVFISSPEGLAITFAEYKDLNMAVMSYTAMSNSTDVISARMGKTVVYAACPPPKDKAKCQKAIDDVK